MSIYIINRVDRIDRWYDVRDEMRRVGIGGYQHFSAFVTSPGYIGCKMSHITILKDELKWYSNESLYVYEDDVVFLNEARLTAGKAMIQLPEDWHVLYLGASPKQPQERYSENLFRLKNAHTTHAMVWNTEHKEAMQYVVDHEDEIKKIDDFYATVIQERFNCFVVYPICCTQRQYPSDTCKRSDVSTIVKNFNLYCK
jgi:glycosyl transferase family 25